MPSKHTSKGAAWEALRLRVLARDNYVCNYCGNEATEADHIVAKANGGKDVMSNLVAACKPCNGRKSDRVLVRLNWFDRDWLTAL